MNQHDAVIKVMEDKGGFSTLGQLYQNVDVSNWKTKTPFASIRRIVQDERYFFKVKPGLWALNSHKDLVLQNFSIGDKSSKMKEDEFSHSYYQGLLVEVGNLEGYETFIPNQDKNKMYLAKPLKEYLTANEFYNFTYEHIIKKVNTIDVCWFNKRKFPNSIFEIEHSSDIQNSLMKFLYLQDFNTKFNIVADKAREREFKSKLSSYAFDSIRDRVKFIEYNSISRYHSKLFELSTLRPGFYK
jgi:hypothetical protein